jgi:hypothetical protein
MPGKTEWRMMMSEGFSNRLTAMDSGDGFAEALGLFVEGLRENPRITGGKRDGDSSERWHYFFWRHQILARIDEADKIVEFLDISRAIALPLPRA